MDGVKQSEEEWYDNGMHARSCDYRNGIEQMWHKNGNPWMCVGRPGLDACYGGVDGIVDKETKKVKWGTKEEYEKLRRGWENDYDEIAGFFEHDELMRGCNPEEYEA
jgi:hypothetical protein